jgi:phosphoribulokinase
MSAKHPIIAITGSSGAGTTTVTTTFQNIFRREGVNAVIVHGDAFHRYDRNEMRVRRTEAENNGQMHFSRFGPEANLFEELETLFRVYGESGTGKVRNYLHDEEEAALYQQKPGTFTPWEEVPSATDLLFYEGLHGAIVTERVNVAQHVDLLIGVVPVINLEWIQKLRRDKMARGYTQEAIVDTILRRMNFDVPDFPEPTPFLGTVPPRLSSRRSGATIPLSPSSSPPISILSSRDYVSIFTTMSMITTQMAPHLTAAPAASI